MTFASLILPELGRFDWFNGVLRTLLIPGFVVLSYLDFNDR